MNLESMRYEGGRANGTAGGVFPNVHTIVYGNRPDTETYYRTNRKDSKGRTIFSTQNGESNGTNS